MELSIDTIMRRGIALSLTHFTNAELAAFTNAVQGFGRVDPRHRCFRTALDAHLIDDTGRVRHLEATITAATTEVERRVAAGTFV